MRKQLQQWKWLVAGCVWLSISAEATEPAFSNQPQPTAHVVIVHDAMATQAFTPVAEKIPAMIARGVTTLTGKTNPTQAWLSLVSTSDVIGIKVHSASGAQSGTRPAVVVALVESMLAAGIAPSNILVWDKQLVHLQLAGFPARFEKMKIRLLGAAQAGWDEKVFYENPILGQPVWGDLEFGKKEGGTGRKSYVSKLVTQEMTKIINVTPMLNHHEASVAGNLYGLALGSVDNAIRFEHSAERLATAVPEICALRELGDRVILNVVDALICQYEGEERSLLHYSVPLNELRFSKDPVALDVLSMQEIGKQRQLAEMPAQKSNLELYQNASILEIGTSNPQKITVKTVK